MIVDDGTELCARLSGRTERVSEIINGQVSALAGPHTPIEVTK